MNKNLANQFIEELNKDSSNYLQLIEGLKSIGTPSAANTIKEIENKHNLINLILEPAKEYIKSLDGIALETSPHISTNKPNSLRDRHLREIVTGYPVNEEFDIKTIRALADKTYPKHFGGKKEFYGIYARVMKGLVEEKKIEVTQAGRGACPTTFKRIPENTETN